eukprot:15462118-Alexandrium_andersonii.AAC.1
MELRAAVFYDKRTSSASAKGRALSKAFPHLGLERGDRLEPSPYLPNVADFDQLQAPATVVWWRRSCETLTRHRNPLMSPVTGIEPKTLGIDWLHALSLGVFLNYCTHLTHALLEAN